MRNCKGYFILAIRKILAALRFSIFVFGIIFLIGLILSFTDIPYWQYYWLGTHNCELEKPPNYIVLLGGGGMPSPDGLIRTYFAAGAWRQTPQSEVIIAIPADTSLGVDSPELLMAKELVQRGVDSTKIRFEPEGYSTFTQAYTIARLFNKKELDTISIRLVTTPEHMFRAVKVFKKAGFVNVGGSPAFETGLSEKKLKRNPTDKKTGLNFRYNMWSYMQYEITVVREYFAIVYYKIKGWI
jgi:uncharacterized SAM-binding protein YcdF (DUF218 family)